MVDSHGKKTSAVVQDSSEVIQVSGLSDADWNPVHFESEAYHVSTFCDEHKITLKTIEREENFDDLWKK